MILKYIQWDHYSYYRHHFSYYCFLLQWLLTQCEISRMFVDYNLFQHLHSNWILVQHFQLFYSYLLGFSMQHTSIVWCKTVKKNQNSFELYIHQMSQVSNTYFTVFFVKCKFLQGNHYRNSLKHITFLCAFFRAILPCEQSNFDLHFLIQRVFPNLHAYKILQNWNFFSLQKVELQMQFGTSIGLIYLTYLLKRKARDSFEILFLRCHNSNGLQ